MFTWNKSETHTWLVRLNQTSVWCEWIRSEKFNSCNGFVWVRNESRTDAETLQGRGRLISRWRAVCVSLLFSISHCSVTGTFGVSPWFHYTVFCFSFSSLLFLTDAQQRLTRVHYCDRKWLLCLIRNLSSSATTTQHSRPAQTTVWRVWSGSHRNPNTHTRCLRINTQWASSCVQQQREDLLKSAAVFLKQRLMTDVLPSIC